MKNSNRTWRKLGAVPPTDLVEARMRLHYASQLSSAIGACYMEPQEDYGHVSMKWADGVLMSGVADGSVRLRGVLDISALKLALVEDGGDHSNPLASLALDGKTVDEAFDWLKGAVSGFGLDPSKLAINTERLPDHGLRSGDPFSIHGVERSLEEFDRYMANADLALHEVADTREGSSEVRVWPHHFDMATVFSFTGRHGGDSMIGAGLSCGDENFAEPYFYVYVWPAPEAPSFPDFRGSGHWYTGEWTGAAAPASSIITKTQASGQRAVSAGFFEFAIDTLLRF